MDGRNAARIGTLPPGWLGALALIVAVEGALSRRALDFTTPGSLQYRATATALHGRDARDAELICFGDSLLKLGVLPRVLAARTGRPAYNLALLGGQPMSAYFLLRRALAEGARPRALLVGFKANILQADPRPLTIGLDEIARPGEVLDLARAARDPSLLAELTLARLVTSYRCRHALRSNIALALRGEAPTARRTNLAYLRNWTINRGSQVEVPPRGPAGSMAPALELIYYPRSWALHPLNALYLRRFLQLAENRAIPIYWLLPPIRTDVQARRERLGLDAAYAGFVRKVVAAYPGVVVVDGRRARYAEALFSDPVHLHRHGARSYSEGLAEVLNRRAADTSPRWIDLPGDRDRPDDVVMEDISESMRRR